MNNLSGSFLGYEDCQTFMIAVRSSTRLLDLDVRI